MGQVQIYTSFKDAVPSSLSADHEATSTWRVEKRRRECKRPPDFLRTERSAAVSNDLGHLLVLQ
jgi:hypothetical protein